MNETEVFSRESLMAGGAFLNFRPLCRWSEVGPTLVPHLCRQVSPGLTLRICCGRKMVATAQIRCVSITGRCVGRCQRNGRERGEENKRKREGRNYGFRPLATYLLLLLDGSWRSPESGRRWVHTFNRLSQSWAESRSATSANVSLLVRSTTQLLPISRRPVTCPKWKSSTWRCCAYLSSPAKNQQVSLWGMVSHQLIGRLLSHAQNLKFLSVSFNLTFSFHVTFNASQLCRLI